MRKYIRHFDRVIGQVITGLPKWVKPIMYIFTWLGEPPFTVGVAAVVLGYGLALGKPLYETAGIIALVTIALGGALKLVLRRKRPITDYAKHMFIKTFSFPSGHAAGSVVSYVMGALIIANRWPEFAAPAITIAVLASILIGISRVYVGAHYASDVIGGWIIGSIGLWFIFSNFYL
jgi:undecaprenyl-diphosphatase